MEDMMAMAMGGRVAEELTFGIKNITSGAAGDIQQITKVAKAMVCVYGMSDKLGTIAYGSRNEQIFVGRDITKSEDYSEDTARELDLEIRKIVKSAKVRADKILTDHQDQLILLSETLMEKETMTAKEVRILLDMATEADLAEPPAKKVKQEPKEATEEKKEESSEIETVADSKVEETAKTSEEEKTVKPVEPKAESKEIEKEDK
jgi:cell division protease FtsH